MLHTRIVLMFLTLRRCYDIVQNFVQDTSEVNGAEFKDSGLRVVNRRADGSSRKSNGNWFQEGSYAVACEPLRT